MHTTYSSSVISFRTYSAFSDCSYYSNERCPSTYCSCCCSFPVNPCKLIVPTNPSFLYGLRQSTLIQWPPSRRFILGSNDRYRSRASIYDVGRCCCSEIYCVKQDRVDKLIRKSCKETCCVKDKSIDVNNIKVRMAAKPRRVLRTYAVGDAEAMLSLLTEETIEECVVVSEKKKSSPYDGKVVCKQNVAIEKLRNGKQVVDSRYRESEWKNHHLKLGRVQSREESRKTKEEREELFKDEDRRSRRRECSSSYDSFSDSGNSENDLKVEIKKENFVGESSSSQKNDLRKSGGVIMCEETKQDWNKYRDEKDVKLQRSTRDDRRVGSSIQQDWRKKSEKKLTEESVDIKSRNESVGTQSHLSQAKESSSMISKKQFNYQEEQLNADLKFLGQSSSHIQKDSGASKYLKSSHQHEHSTQKSRQAFETTSTVGRMSVQGEALQIVGQPVQESGCDFCKTCGRTMEKSKKQYDFQRHAEQSRINARKTINMESLSDYGHRTHEKSSSLLQSSLQEESQRHDQIHTVTGQASAKRNSQDYRETVFIDDTDAQTTLRRKQQSESRMHDLVKNSRTSADNQSQSRRTKEETNLTSQIYVATGEVDARKNSQHSSEIVDADASYQSSLSSQQKSETRMNHLEENRTSVSAAEEVKRLCEESGDKRTENIVSSKASQTEIGDSRVHSSNMEMDTQYIFDKRVHNEQTYSKAVVKSVEELVEKRKWIDETIVQSTLQTEVPGSSIGFSGEATISQPYVPLISQTGVQQYSEEEIKSGQLLGTSAFREASSNSVGNKMGRTMEIGSGSSHKHPQAIALSSYSEVIESGNKSGEEYSPEDTLVSAAHMQESSTMIVGELVEKMSHEASKSESRTKKKLPKLDLLQQDKGQMLKGSTQLDTDKIGLPKRGSEWQSGVSSPSPISEKSTSEKLDSKRSSLNSLTKGSSDQRWDVKDHFVQESSEMESSEGATSESVVVVRTGKFLWNIVARMCRLRWGSIAENQKSPIKRQSSPSGSAGGEMWFSGDEADEANGDGMKAEQTSLLQVTTSDNSLLGTTTSQTENVVDVGASSSSSAIRMSSPSGGGFVDESINLKVPQHTSLPNPSVDLLKPSARQLRRSLAFEEIDEEDNKESPISSSEEQRDYPVDERQPNVSGPEGIDFELKRGKLQRSKLVLQRFDEWEDAYRREREQQKVDEIFMREALSEAIKAADSWEVPVGAVLVQNGKVIARGYNLVEELRDSTAHAEMLCIREASNILRTWRLSETTLYVTLEPCPMCAGAILQARISTLVWGAPNKLLGADGSWIRLFPEGMEGEERSEVADKPAAPVHPFHPKMKIRRGILQEECADVMQQFFQLKRRKAKRQLQESPSEESGQPSCFPRPQHRSKLLHKMHNVFHPSKQSD